MQRLCEGLRIGFDLLHIIALEGFLQLRNGIVDLLHLGRIRLVADFLYSLFCLVHQRLCIVPSCDSFLALLVVFLVQLGVLLHPLNFFIRQAGRRGNIDLLFLPRAQILGGYMDNAVRIDIKGDLNLRYASRCRRNIGQFETAKSFVVRSHGPFALEHMDIHRRLIVCRSGENLCFLGRNGGVSLNHRSEYAAQCFNAEGQWRHIEKKHILHFPFQHARLNSRAHRDRFIRVDSFVRLFPKFIPNERLYCRNAGGATHEKDLFNIRGRNARISHGNINGRHRGLHKVLCNAVKFRPGQGSVEVNGLAVNIHREEGQVYFRRHDAGKLNFGLFTRFLQALIGHGITAQLKAILLLEGIGNPVHHAGIEIISAQVAVAVGCLDFKDTVSQIQDRHIEGTAPEVIDEEGVLFSILNLIEPIGQRRCSGFIDDAEHIESRNFARVLRGLALTVREIGRAGNDCIGNLLAQVGFRIGFQLLQNHCGDFLRGIALVINGHFIIAAHMALNGNDGAVRIGHSLALCQLSHQPFPRLGEAHHRRSQTGAFRIRNDNRLAAFHDGHHRICRPQINTNYFRHKNSLLQNLLYISAFAGKLSIVYNLHLGRANHPVLHLVPLLEDHRNGIVFLPWHGGLHDCLVKMWVKYRPLGRNFFHTESGQDFLQLPTEHDEPFHIGGACFILFHMAQSQIEAVQHREKFCHHLGGHFILCFGLLIAGASAEIIKIRLQPAVLVHCQGQLSFQSRPLLFQLLRPDFRSGFRLERL